MDKTHRVAIQTNFSSLVEQTDLNNMVSKLFEKGVFSERMIDPYKNTNLDERSRKRLLYLDVTRRGPHAFEHLVDSLVELGYWGLAQDLRPDGPFHSRMRHSSTSQHVIPTSPQANEPGFLSIPGEKKKFQDEKRNSPHNSQIPAPSVEHNGNNNDDTPDAEEEPEPLPPSAKFKVIKSTQFLEFNSEKMYQSRCGRRVMLLFNYATFPTGTDPPRPGSDVDLQNLRYVFGEMGFRTPSFQNLTTVGTLDALKSKVGLVGIECLFLVVMSHGHVNPNGDTDIRCSDGGLISVKEIVGQYSNKNFPELRGVPKVFIFQMCRGTEEDFMVDIEKDISMYSGGEASSDVVGPSTSRSPPLPLTIPPPSPADNSRRTVSDILIAYSTLPGYVSRRDKLGSWYIQALCSVFAEHAHDTDVAQLFWLVDREYERRYRFFTSSTVNWGFNKQFYLYPGLAA